MSPMHAWRLNHFHAAQTPRRGLGADWVDRYIRQRKRGLLMPLLRSTEDEGAWWIATTLIGMWDHAELVPIEQIRQRIVAAEAEPDVERISAQSEKGAVRERYAVV